MPRNQGSHLDDREIEILRKAYKEGLVPLEASKLVGARTRCVNKYYAMFRTGSTTLKGYRYERRPSLVKPNPGHLKDREYIGPVKHRPCPPPNALPWATKERLMAGK